jgi:hypothetical protein
MLLSECYYASSHYVPSLQPFTLGRKARCAGCPANLLTATSDSDDGATKLAIISGSPISKCVVERRRPRHRRLMWHKHSFLWPATLTAPSPPPFHPIPPHSYPMSPHFYPRLEMAVTPLSPHPSMVSVMDFLSLATRLLTADGPQPQKHKTQRFSRCEYLPMFAIAQSCILSTYEIDGPQAELLYKQRAKHGNNASPANLR